MNQNQNQQNDSERIDQSSLSLAGESLPRMREIETSPIRETVLQHAKTIGTALAGLAIFLGGIDKSNAATITISGTASIFQVDQETEPGESPLQPDDEIDFYFEIDTDSLPNTNVSPGFYDDAVQFGEVSIYNPSTEEPIFTSFDYNYTEVENQQNPNASFGDSVSIGGEISQDLSEPIFIVLDLGFNFPNIPEGDNTLDSVDLREALFAVKSNKFNNQSLSFSASSSNFNGGGDIFFIDISSDVEGDYNIDGKTDAADYTVWRDTFGSTDNLAADGSGDGIVASLDYDIWEENYGESQFSSLSQAQGKFVPEPTGVYLALSTTLASLLRRKTK